MLLILNVTVTGLFQQKKIKLNIKTFDSAQVCSAQLFVLLRVDGEPLSQQSRDTVTVSISVKIDVLQSKL